MCVCHALYPVQSSVPCGDSLVNYSALLNSRPVSRKELPGRKEGEGKDGRRKKLREKRRRGVVQRKGSGKGGTKCNA